MNSTGGRFEDSLWRPPGSLDKHQEEALPELATCQAGYGDVGKITPEDGRRDFTDAWSDGCAKSNCQCDHNESSTRPALRSRRSSSYVQVDAIVLFSDMTNREEAQYSMSLMREERRDFEAGAGV